MLFRSEYQVQVSDNAQDWNTVHHERNGQDERKVIAGLAARGRYLRIYCLRPGPFPLFSLWEIGSEDGPTAQALEEVRRRMAQARLEAGKRLVGSLEEQGVREIIFAVRQPGVDGHWYANFGYYAADVNNKCYRAGGGRLCRLNLATGEVTVLFEDPQGSVRDPQVHYDGRRIV